MQRRPSKRAAFTLLELMLAVTLLALASTVTFLSFQVVSSAWKRGIVLTDNLHHGDFVMEQLTMALRSAYYPDMRNPIGYGFTLEDEGDDQDAADVISWVKLGGALVGRDTALSDSPHRVVVKVGQDEEERNVVSVKAWRINAQPDDFDPEEDVEPVVLSRKVTGLNCRAAYRMTGEEDAEKEIDWLDEWEETNRIPTVVELTLYLEPIEPGGDPVEIKRIVGIPVAPLSWR